MFLVKNFIKLFIIGGTLIIGNFLWAVDTQYVRISAESIPNVIIQDNIEIVGNIISQTNYTYPINKWGCFLICLNYLAAISYNENAKVQILESNLIEQTILYPNVIRWDCYILNRIEAYKVISSYYSKQKVKWTNDLYIAKVINRHSNNRITFHFIIVRLINYKIEVVFDPLNKNNYEQNQLKEIFNYDYYYNSKN